MKYTVKNMKGRKVTIHDNIGRLIPAVKSFDSETFRIQFYPITIKKNGSKSLLMSEMKKDGTYRLKLITTIWRGAYVKINGERIE